jgi:phage FluMu gp28-like protein
MENHVLLEYQKRWIADKATVKICEKSRRIGLSWTEAADSALLAASQKGMDVFYIGYNKEMSEEFISDVAFWAKNYQLAASEVEQEIVKDERKDILTFRVRFASGFKVVALSSRPSNLRGRQGKAIIDEAAFHEDLKELQKAAYAFLMWGGKVSIISTHNGVESEFNELITDVRAGKLPYSIHKVTLDDALDEGLYRRICLTNNQKYSKDLEIKWRQDLIDFYGDGADEELFCIPRHSGGAYFSRVLVESIMSKDLSIIRYKLSDDFALLPDRQREYDCHQWLRESIFPELEKFGYGNCYLGFDFARSGDLSVLMIGQEQENLTLKVFLTLEMRNIPFKQQEQILFSVCDRLPKFAGGSIDARGNGQYLAEVMGDRYKGKITQVQISNKWYQEAFPKYKAAIEDKKIMLPASADLLQDHRMIMVDKGVPKAMDKRVRGLDGGFRHSDGAIAACLLWWSISQNNKPVFSPDFGFIDPSWG